MPDDPLELTSALDMVKVREQIDRHLKKRGKLMDRVEKIALQGEARERSKRENAYNHRALPSDPPAVQLTMMIAQELEDGDWSKIEDDYKRAQVKNGLYKQLTDLISGLEENATKTFQEYCTLIDQHMRKSEHDDKMRRADGHSDADMSDAEVLELAQQSRAARLAREAKTDATDEG